MEEAQAAARNDLSQSFTGFTIDDTGILVAASGCDHPNGAVIVFLKKSGADNSGPPYGNDIFWEVYASLADSTDAAVADATSRCVNEDGDYGANFRRVEPELCVVAKQW
jgi:hypothetical protein